jgi:hypothetical protein
MYPDLAAKSLKHTIGKWAYRAQELGSLRYARDLAISRRLRGVHIEDVSWDQATPRTRQRSTTDIEIG